MDWGKVKFFLGEVGRSFTRNAGMQITAIGTVAVTIIILGAFLYVRSGVAQIGGDVLSKITISVYMDAAASAHDVNVVRNALAADKRVLDAQYVPKKQGLQEMEQRFKGQIDVSAFLTENPLPDKFRVHARDAAQVPLIAASLRKLPGVHDVEYGSEVVNRLLQLGSVARRVGIVVIAIFALVAGIIIANTIRLTVFARRREIAIMQLVGATNTYIRMPFICEGVIDGILGALLAVGVLALTRLWFFPKLALALPWMQMNLVQVNLGPLVLELLATGAAVGAIASWISVGRHLET